jgi:tetratricopeptide (TPR) repeat protein
MEASTVESRDTTAWFRFENIPLFLIFTLVFLLPVFFLPSLFVSRIYSKALLVFTLIPVALVAFSIFSLKRGSVMLPRGKFYIVTAATALVFFISTLFSSSLTMSFFGYGVESNSLLVLLCGSVLSLLTALIFRSQRRIFYGLIVFLSSLILPLLFHLVRISFGVDALLPQFFPSLTASLAGTWYDLGILLAAGVLISLLAAELLTLSKRISVLVYVVSAGCVVLLALQQFTVLWMIVAAGSAVSLAVVFQNKKRIAVDDEMLVEHNGKIVHVATHRRVMQRISIPFLILFIVALVFSTSWGNNFSSQFASQFGVANIEVRPSFGATYAVFNQSISKNPYLGSGLNRFAQEWELYKPAQINDSQFWNTDFKFAVGFIPTIMIETGLLGSFALVALLCALLAVIFLSIKAAAKQEFSKHLTYVSGVATIFFVAVLCVYTPGFVVVLLTFFFVGLSLALAHNNGALVRKVYVYSSIPKTGFFVVFALIILSLIACAVLYVGIMRARSAYSFERSVHAFSVLREQQLATNFMQNALQQAPLDTYYRELSSLYIARLQNIAANNTENVSQEAVLEFQGVLELALMAARSATAFDEGNYRNWLALAHVFKSIVPLGVQQSASSALDAYEQAKLRSPHNPAIAYAQAEVSILAKDGPGALSFLDEAISLKRNYAEAYFLKSRLHVNRSERDLARKTIEQLVAADPRNVEAYFALGVSFYEDREWANAAQMFLNAITLVPEFANAKYYLGLSLYNLGNKIDARKQFEDVASLNPDNEDVKKILQNLDNGVPPLI